MKNLFGLIVSLSKGSFIYYFVTLTIPFLLFMGYGAYKSVELKVVLNISLLSLGLVSIILVPFFLIKLFKTNKKSVLEKNIEISDGYVKANPEWSDQEMLIWKNCKKKTREETKKGLEWENIQESSMSMFKYVSQVYGKDPLGFTPTEMLKLIEEVSKRYRAVINKYGVAIDDVDIKTLKNAYDIYQNYGGAVNKAYKFAKFANDVKNAVVKPQAMATDFVKDKVIEMTGLTDYQGFQNRIKEALLDEVASVSIDLYSNRFKVSDDEIKTSSVSVKDENIVATPLEKIRVSVVGQTSSGKSSLINSINKSLVAEVDGLPSTQDSTVFDVKINDADVKMVDMKGLDGDDKTEIEMFNEILNSDIVLWVLKANQSSRELDVKLVRKLNKYYDHFENISVKKPVFIFVLNQVDMLGDINDWSPANLSANKEEIINSAAEFNKKILEAKKIIPTSLSFDKEKYGEKEMLNEISKSIDDANNVQRNRQRIDASKSRNMIFSNALKVKGLATEIVKNNIFK